MVILVRCHAGVWQISFGGENGFTAVDASACDPFLLTANGPGTLSTFEFCCAGGPTLVVVTE
jgi:hypothetical protein